MTAITNEPAWAGRIVLVYVKDPGPSVQAGIALGNPRLELRHGEQFLVGEIPPLETDWASGLEAGVRWTEVVHYVSFATLEEYQKRIAEAPAAWEVGVVIDL